jgi:hypothetical protein
LHKGFGIVKVEVTLVMPGVKGVVGQDYPAKLARSLIIPLMLPNSLASGSDFVDTR